MPKQILLVDDSVTIHRVVQITFAHEDFAITAVKTGDEGIARARDLKPDLVLADAGMSGKSGYDVVAAVKGDPATAAVPCLILTGNFSPYDEAKGQKAGADGFVVKPFETQALIDKVNDLVKKGAGARPVAAAAAASPPVPAVTAAPKPPVPVAVPIPAPPKPPAPPSVIEPLSKPLSVVAQETAAKPPAPAPVPIPQPAARPPVPGAERRTMMGFPAVTPPADLVPPKPVTPPPPMAPPPPAPAVMRNDGGSLGAAAAEAQAMMPAEVPQMPRPSMIPHTPTPQPKAAPAPAPAAAAKAPQPRATLMGIPAVNPASLGVMPPGAVALPPSPPKPAAWAPPAAEAPRPAPVAPAPIPPPPAAPSSAVAQAVNEIAARGPEYAALAHLSREVLEKIAWEVVPDLAEVIIREQLDRLVKERQG